MCQDFMYYYPKQTRNNEPLAFCGFAAFDNGQNDGGDVGATLCGSLSQPDNAFMLPVTDQLERGDGSYPVDKCV